MKSQAPPTLTSLKSAQKGREGPIAGLGEEPPGLGKQKVAWARLKDCAQGMGWGEQHYPAVAFDHAVMMCLYLICVDVGDLLTIVSGKQFSMITFSRNTRSEGLGWKRSVKGEERNLYLLDRSLGMR